MALVARLKDRAGAVEQGRAQFLSIGVCDSIANLRLSAYLTMLRTRSPTLTIDFQSMGGDQALVAVEQGQVDAAFILGLRKTGTLCRTHFWGEHLEVAMATGHRLGLERTLPLRALLAADALLVAEPWAAIAEGWLCEVSGDQGCPTLRVLPTISGLLTAVGLDLGIALVPSGVAATFARVDVTTRQIAGRQPPVSVVMLSGPDPTHPAIAVLRGIAHEHIDCRVRPVTSEPDGPAETPDHSP